MLTLWTDDPALARQADAAGVDRIGVDLDRLGKAERQGGRGTWISPHTESALSAIAPQLGQADLFARIDPLNGDTPRQAEEVLARGARVLMLPMVATPEEAESFVSLVDARATVILLVERVEALARLGELASVEGVDEIHLGLNDLALSMGLASRWSILAGDLVSRAAQTVREAGLRFGLGGIGRAGDRTLPIPSDLIYAEYARTGATAALISRSFVSGVGCLADEVKAARQCLESWRHRPPEALAAAHAELAIAAGAGATW